MLLRSQDCADSCSVIRLVKALMFQFLHTQRLIKVKHLNFFKAFYFFVNGITSNFLIRFYRFQKGLYIHYFI